jgi:hypothetical protein
MTITLEIPDELVPCIEEYLTNQVTAVYNPVTKAQSLKRNFDSPENWIQLQVDGLLEQVAMQHPSEAMREKLEAAQALRDEVRTLAKTTVTTNMAPMLPAQP